MPLFIGRKSSVNAITQAMGTNKYIFLVAQKDEKTEDPKNEDLHSITLNITHLFQYTKHLFRNFFIELDIGFKAF
jgi:ATP-dependent Lon protease